MNVRLLPFARASGAANMAADEAMLVTAADHGVASLRFYGWSEPTVSLGYFQLSAARADDGRLAALPFVRRATGGLALVHHHELTYAVALPAGKPWQVRGESWLCRMHQVIAAALAACGVEAAQCPADAGGGGALCFRHHTPGDLIIDGHKVVGSAQRKLRGALLQHGAVLLARSEFTPQLPGVRELTGVGLAPEALADAVVAASGWPVEAGEWTPEEAGRAARLAVEKYGGAAWNEKR